ncbi:SipW-dependent-type signal peptide-containing protein [Halorubrum aethiopicum]|uniref:SipW-dependent-type signal peptide-containing protein n=1 Tax=Halorubrum aethiopicum TaxID=1758255 RepID=UPI000835EC44|nr:SipW-dependent-type signal peptide-containing protein [Halorubrum aethiopicum]
MNDDTIGLSRRKMLFGLGAVGVASAGAGLGTTAYFSDEEGFTGNQLEAGTLDLFVHVDYSEDQGSYAQYSTPSGTFIHGNVVGGGDGEPLSIQVSDLKPGDSGEGEFCFSIVDNPAYMWMCGELTANDENGQTEPETDADTTGGDPGEGMGELADAMQVTVSYCTADGEVGNEIVSGSLADVMLALQAGVPLSGDGDASVPLDGRDPFEGVTEAFLDDEPNVAEQCVCVEWEVPTDVGNEIQSDSVTFDFEFYAEQSRHNDGTNNPCVDEVVVTAYDNDWKGQTLANPTDGNVYTSVAYGQNQVVLGFTFVDDGDGMDFLDTADYSSTNLPVAVDADDDGTHDWQLIWQPNAGLPDAPFGYVENTGGSYGAAQSLPAGFSAQKVGNTILFGVPRSEIASTFRLLAYGSTGGEGPIAKVNADPAVGPDFYDSSDAVVFSE